MKYIVILLFVCNITVILCDKDMLLDTFLQEMDPSDEVTDLCVAETGFTDDDLDRINEATSVDLESTDMDVVVNRLGCMLSCIYHAEGLMVNGKLSSTKVHAIFEKDTSNSVTDYNYRVRRCIQRGDTKEDSCDVALSFTICLTWDVGNENIPRFE